MSELEGIEIIANQQVFGFKVKGFSVKGGKVTVNLEAETTEVTAGELTFGDVLKQLSIMNDADVEVPINVVSDYTVG